MSSSFAQIARNCIQFISVRMHFFAWWFSLFLLPVLLLWNIMIFAHNDDNKYKTYFVYSIRFLMRQTKTRPIHTIHVPKVLEKNHNIHLYARFEIITLFRLLAPHRIGIDVFVMGFLVHTGTGWAVVSLAKTTDAPKQLYHLSWRSCTYVIFSAAKVKLADFPTARRFRNDTLTLRVIHQPLYSLCFCVFLWLFFLFFPKFYFLCAQKIE